MSPPDGSSSLGSPGKASALASAFGSLDSRANRKTYALLIATLNLAYPDHDFSSIRPDEFVREPSAGAVLSTLSSALSHLRAQQSTSPVFNLGLSGGKSSIFRSFSSYPSSPPKVSVSLPSISSVESDGSVGMPPPPALVSDSESPPKIEALHPFFRQVLDPIIDLHDCEVYSFQPEVDSDPHADEDGSSVGDFDQDDDLEGYLDDNESVAGTKLGGSVSGRGGMDSDDDELGCWQMDGLSYASSSPRRRPSTSRRSSRGPYKRSLSALSLHENEPSGRANGGLLWSSKSVHLAPFAILTRLSWFFYHRTSKRILFITLWARTKGGFAALASPTPPSLITLASGPKPAPSPLRPSGDPFARAPTYPPTPPQPISGGPLKASGSINGAQSALAQPVRKRARY